MCIVRGLTQGAGICLQFVRLHIIGAASSQGNNDPLSLGPKKLHVNPQMQALMT